MPKVPATPAGTRVPELLQKRAVDRRAQELKNSRHALFSAVQLRAVPGARSTQLLAAPSTRIVCGFPSDEKFPEPPRPHSSQVRHRTAPQAAGFQELPLLSLPEQASP